MAYLARWHVQGNAPKEQVFRLQKTVDNYQKHLKRFAGDKLLYFEVDDLED